MISEAGRKEMKIEKNEQLIIGKDDMLNEYRIIC